MGTHSGFKISKITHPKAYGRMWNKDSQLIMYTVWYKILEGENFG